MSAPRGFELKILAHSQFVKFPLLAVYALFDARFMASINSEALPNLFRRSPCQPNWRRRISSLCKFRPKVTSNAMGILVHNSGCVLWRCDYAAGAQRMRPMIGAAHIHVVGHRLNPLVPMPFQFDTPLNTILFSTLPVLCFLPPPPHGDGLRAFSLAQHLGQ